MKKIFLAAAILFATCSIKAQQKEGKIMYERKVQMQVSFGGDLPPGIQNAMPTSRTDRFELNFANNQMAWRMMEEDIKDDAMANDGRGNQFVFRTIGGGADDMTFCDFEKSKKVEQREFMDKKFIIADSLRKGNWKLTGETKTILGYTCRQATSQRFGKRMMMTMNDGKMERKEVDDTTNMIAWFTTDIPVAIGPEVQGQLPGAILELETNNGRTLYTATEVLAKPSLSAIKEPTKGKKVTPDEFTAERNKLMEQMQQNGNMRIRMN